MIGPRDLEKIIRLLKRRVFLDIYIAVLLTILLLLRVTHS
jgi:hypothetical protein